MYFICFQVRVLYDFQAEDSNELTAYTGEELTVMNTVRNRFYYVNASVSTPDSVVGNLPVVLYDDGLSDCRTRLCGLACFQWPRRSLPQRIKAKIVDEFG